MKISKQYAIQIKIVKLVLFYQILSTVLFPETNLLFVTRIQKQSNKKMLAIVLDIVENKNANSDKIKAEGTVNRVEHVTKKMNQDLEEHEYERASPIPNPQPAPKPKEEEDLEEVVDNTEMISLDGIMVIIVDLHGEIILRNPPINTKLIGIKNIASIAAAPAGMCNIISPKDTAEFQERFVRENLKVGIKKMVEKKLTSNLQKIENIAADASAAVGNPKSNVGKNMSSVSPDMCVTLLQDLQNHLKTSNVPLWKTSVDADKILKTTDMQKKAALENPDDRYRSLNIIKGFGVPRVPYTNKSISYNNKDVGVESMGVTTMRFRVNKNNKVTCSTRFIGVDDLFSEIKDKIITPALQESTTYSTTMERLISRVIEIAQEDKLDPESIVVVDLTCSNINDTPLQSKPLATNINSVNMPGGSKKKPKKHKKNTKKIKRRTHIRNRVAS